MFEPAIVLRKTQSLCPQCGSEAVNDVASGNSPAVLRNHTGVVEAQIVESGGKVFMQKRCDRHGEFQDLLASDAVFYKRMETLAVTPEREYRPQKPVHVATKGIRFAQEPAFAARAKQAGLHGVFLQIDGVTDESNAHRGIQHFMDVKMAAL